MKFLALVIFLVNLIGTILPLRLDLTYTDHVHLGIEKNKVQKSTHLYYNVQQTQRISTSNSIKYLNECKEKCLKFHQIFPFQFKYHRKIYRQNGFSSLKYITGECLYSFISKQQKHKYALKNEISNQKSVTLQEKNNVERKWYHFKELQKFLSMAVVQNQEYIIQQESYSDFLRKCQDQNIKISDENMENLKFSMVHSDFEYYEDGDFKNLKPFDDLEELLGGIAQNS